MENEVHATDQMLSADSMLAKARHETGLEDLGDPEFIEAFRYFVRSVVIDKLFNALGVAAFESEMHRILINRLRFAEDMKRHPEILDEDVADPIVIIGLPRTGTTKLQRMLSADPAVQRLELWRLLNVAPFPHCQRDTDRGQDDPRIEAARRAVGAMAEAMPEYVSSHPFGAEEVDEDLFLQLYGLKCLATYVAYPSPTFWNWMSHQSQESNYRFLKQALQYLQWQDGGKSGRPWVLKSPVHIGTVDKLLKHFPKALFVFTHRDPRQVIASLCRLMHGQWSAVLDASLTTPKVVGELILRVWSSEIMKHMDIRERLGSRLNILDVQYQEINLDSMNVISRIYRQSGRDLAPLQEKAMLNWERTHPQHHAGKYSYSLEDYGLTPDVVYSAFREYIQRFINVDAR